MTRLVRNGKTWFRFLFQSQHFKQTAMQKGLKIKILKQKLENPIIVVNPKYYKTGVSKKTLNILNRGFKTASSEFWSVCRFAAFCNKQRFQKHPPDSLKHCKNRHFSQKRWTRTKTWCLIQVNTLFGSKSKSSLCVYIYIFFFFNLFIHTYTRIWFCHGVSEWLRKWLLDSWLALLVDSLRGGTYAWGADRKDRVWANAVMILPGDVRPFCMNRT